MLYSKIFKKTSNLFQSSSLGKSAITNLKMEKSLTERRNFILVFLTIFILSVTIFRQQITNALTLLKENEKLKEKIGVLTTKVNYLENLDKNQLESRVVELERVYPSQKPVLEFINAVVKLAAEEGVFLSAFTLSPGKIEEGKKPEETNIERTTEGKSDFTTPPESFNLQFKVDGELEKVKSFIKNIQKTSPLAKVKDFSIQLNPKEGNALLGLSLKVEVYFQKLPSVLPAIETPLAHLSQEEEIALARLAEFKIYPFEVLPMVSVGKDNLFKKPL